jgi:hypothetical protein
MAARIPPKKRSLYEILGVPRDAMAIDIGMAYKKRLAELDRKAGADPNELVLVREAYHILCQPRERELYDASLITREERDEARTRPSPDIVLDAGDDESAADHAKKRKLLLMIGGLLLVIIAMLVALLMRPKATEGPRISVDAVTELKPPPPPVAPKKRTAQEVLALASPAIARVMAYEVSGRQVPVGSGILVAPNAIVTTCHALPPSGTIVALLGADSIPANLGIMDETQDLCRLTVAGAQAAPIAASSEEPKAGDVVYAVAQHKPNALSVVEGTVRNVRATPNGKSIEISLPVAPSASGGALFDAYGRWVGILTSKSSGANTALPAGAIAQMRTRGQPEPKQ